MSNIYALCKFCEVENEFIPLEVRPYSDDFQAGAASRDAEVAELRNDVKMLREFVKLLRDYIPASAVGNMTVQEALSATKCNDRS